MQNHAANRGAEHVVLGFDGFGVSDGLIIIGSGHVDERAVVTKPDRRLCFDFACIPCHEHFIDRAERASFSASTGLWAREVVNAENHILRRNRNGLAAGGRQQILCRKHQHGGFDLRFG